MYFGHTFIHEGREMSRSYKKNPVVKDNDRTSKRLANRAVRNRCGLSNGGCYKKVFNQYNICDWWMSLWGAKSWTRAVTVEDIRVFWNK